ncbi:mycothiol transferase [Phycicoccus sonneratiae]|uniref:DinB family protein n=1 Tax=Phycicoccus sonneratiae TaxID=2807628 RepID=A0ABS2CPI2_9MICO|nr:DinB family protein [Phycicoccus sonneraticus]MBM6401789.1 DinB family protein [Phycicoccus sonneraticus]
MATTSDLLLDAFDRVRETVHGLLDDLPEERLAEPPAEGANTVAWLVWHLTRVLDTHVADAFDRDVVWTADGWADRFGLPFPASAHGYGMDYADVLAVCASAADLRGYFDATATLVDDALRGVTDADLDRVVDEDWDPPVTLGVRLVSAINDATQHVGQAAYAAGILTRR